MAQTIRGLILGIVLSLMGTMVYNGTSHAEWFNSRAPESDSSNLKQLRYSSEEISASLKELVQVQKQILEEMRNRPE